MRVRPRNRPRLAFGNRDDDYPAEFVEDRALQGVESLLASSIPCLREDYVLPQN